MTALSLMRLIPDPPGRIVSGTVKLAGRDLLKISEEEMRRVRGNEISMIFQEPMTSLNPVMTIGKQIAEALILHRDMDRKAALKRAVEMLDLVRIPEPAQRAKEYPHQLSGGMRQRAMIAMALACNPKVLIADEPTTALDVTIQAQILELILELQREFGAAVILITHDLGVVAETARRRHRHVCRPQGRGGRGRRAVRPAAASLHGGPAGLDPAARPAARRRPGPHTDRLQEIPASCRRCSTCPKGCAFAPRCPQGRRPLPARAAGLRAEAAGPLGGLLAHAMAGKPNMPVLEVTDLKKHFPVQQGLLRRTVGQVYAVDGISFTIGVGETLGAGGRERLRQDHGRPRRAAPDRADLRLDRGRRARDITAPAQGRAAALPAADADHLPGPVLLAQSAHDGGRHRGRAAAGARRRRAARNAREQVAALFARVGPAGPRR